MNNIQCVCIDIYQQLSQLLQSFTQQATSATTFTHNGGFGDTIPSGSTTLGNDGRFSGLGSDSGVFTFAVFLMIMAMLFLSA